MHPSLRPANPDDAISIAKVLVESRLAFLPYAPSPHTPDEIGQWVAEQLLPGGRNYVVELDGKVAAIMALSSGPNGSWVDQLYVLPGHCGQGLGSLLLEHAHAALPRPIRLYTFQTNSGSRRFYERHGYQAIAFSDGASNEEQCPDVLYELNAG